MKLREKVRQGRKRTAGERVREKERRKEEMNNFFSLRQKTIIFSRTRHCHAKPSTPQESLNRALSDGAIHIALNFRRPQTLPAGLEFFIFFLRQRHPPRPPAYRTLSPKWRTAEYKYAARKSGVAENTAVEGRTRARREERDIELGGPYSAQL